MLRSSASGPSARRCRQTGTLVIPAIPLLFLVLKLQRIGYRDRQTLLLKFIQQVFKIARIGGNCPWILCLKDFFEHGYLVPQPFALVAAQLLIHAFAAREQGAIFEA